MSKFEDILKEYNLIEVTEGDAETAKVERLFGKVQTALDDLQSSLAYKHIPSFKKATKNLDKGYDGLIKAWLSSKKLFKDQIDNK